MLTATSASTSSLVEHPPARLATRSSWGAVRAIWSRAVERLGAVMVVFFALVVIASGFSAIVLLGWPGSTDTTFSWTLRPDAAAALIGGLYLVSAVAFSYALTRTWTEVKGLWIAVYGLAVPTFVATLVHNEVFDFSRWQALAWLAIFTGAPIAVTVVLVAKRHEHPPAEGRRPMASWTRVVLAAMAVVLATLAVLLLLDPTRRELSEHSPFPLIGLTGAYLGRVVCVRRAAGGLVGVVQRLAPGPGAGADAGGAADRRPDRHGPRPRGGLLRVRRSPPRRDHPRRGLPGDRPPAGLDHCVTPPGYRRPSADGERNRPGLRPGRPAASVALRHLSR